MSERTQRIRMRIQKDKNPIDITKFRINAETRLAHPNEAIVTNQATAYRRILNEIPIYIMDDELIVGSAATRPYGVELSADYGSWDRDEIEALKEEGYPFSEEDEKIFYDLNEKYKPIGTFEGLNSAILEHKNMEAFCRSSIVLPGFQKVLPGEPNNWGGRAKSGLGQEPGWGFFCIDYEMVFRKGLNTMIQECDDAINAIRFTELDAYKRLLTLKAMKDCLTGMIEYAARFSKLASEKAEAEANGQRRQELLLISDICSKVPANAPTTFREAMQMYWFIVVCAVLPTSVASLGRPDQLLYPYYKKDIESGSITDEEVIELLELFRLKIMEIDCIPGKVHRLRAAGKAKWFTMVVGGVKRDGTDACNELTLHVLESIMRTATPHPNVSLRVCDTTPDEVLQKAAKCQAMGMSMPSFIGDRSYIEFLTKAGASLEDARDYCICGCNDGVIPGKSMRMSVYMCVLSRIFQIWLNDGVDPETGLQVGPKTGNLDRFQSYEEMYEAFVKDMKYYQQMCGERVTLESLVVMEYFPCPLLGSFMSEGISQGKGLFDINYPLVDFSACSAVGAVDLAQSLEGIRTLVYEEKKVTLSGLKKILDANWEGHEALCEECRELPKYGNDIDAIDEITAQLYADWADGIDAVHIGGHYYMRPAAISITSYEPGGTVTGATPDGRHAGEILTDACASPSSGADKNGFLAVLRSAMKLPQDRYSSFLFNQKFHPSALRTDEDCLKLGKAIQVYLKKGKHIQFNVVDENTLRAAQEHPEQYEDLMVRVAGYSTYFTILSRKIQDQVIERTSHVTV